MLAEKNPLLHKALCAAEKPILYAAVFFLVLEGPTVYHSMTAVEQLSVLPGRLIDYITIALLALLAVHAALRYGMPAAALKRAGMVLGAYYAAVALWFFPTLPTNAFVFGFLYYFAIDLPLLMAYMCFASGGGASRRIFYAFADVMCVLAAVSLVFWLFGSIAGAVSTSETVTADWGGIYDYPSYMGIYFERQTANVFGTRVIRNQGIFTEAPMYDAYLVAALCVEAYMRPWKKRSAEWSSEHLRAASIPRMLLLLLTIVSTLTSSGLIFAAVIAASVFFLYPLRGKYARPVKIALGAAAAVAAVVVVVTVIALKSGSMSFRIRVDDFAACFKSWLDSPVFGIGYNNTSGIIAHMSGFRLDNTGLATGAGMALAQGGLVAAAIYTLPLVMWVVESVKRRNYGTLCFAAVSAVLLVTAVINYTALMLLMLAPGYVSLCGGGSVFALPGKRTSETAEVSVHERFAG